MPNFFRDNSSFIQTFFFPLKSLFISSLKFDTILLKLKRKVSNPMSAQKNLLLVSTDDCFYGSMKGATSILKRFVAKTMLNIFPTEENISLVEKAVKAYKIKGILARGYWALALEDRLEIPVFPFQQDAFDLVLSIERLINKGYQKIGLLSCVPSRKNSYNFGEMVILRFNNIPCYLAHIKDDEELQYTLNRMVSIYQIDILCGDRETLIMAEQLGVPYCPLQLSSTFLINTIDNAENVIGRIEREKRHTEYIETLTNIISESSLFTNELGQITFFNAQAGKNFNLSASKLPYIQDIVDQPMEELLKEQANRIVDINGKNFIMNVMPVTLHEHQNFSFLFSDTKNIEHVEISIRRQSHENGLIAKQHFADIVHEDPKTVTIINMAKRYALSDGTVLITGESGVGKEVYANSIHNESHRKNGPFVAINCAAFNENLIESELFGYEKGSFTGALSSGKTGLFELAHKGTLFLDEIGELPISMQAKLLRVLQEHEVRHLGGSKIIPVDVRIIAATNKDLHQMVSENTFRNDLFFRLSLLELTLPPLRERPGDIIPLFKYFLNRLVEKSGKKIFWNNDSVFSPLLQYDWPGNIRELENIAERTILLADAMQLTKAMIQNLILMAAGSNRSAVNSSSAFTTEIHPDLSLLEGQYIEHLLKVFNNNKDEVCNYLGISKPTFWRKLAYARDHRQ